MEMRKDGAEAEGGELSVMEYTGLLTQDAEPGGTTLVDSRNAPGNALDSTSPLAGRGKVYVQLLHALGAASPLPARLRNGHSPELRGGYPG